MARSRRDEPEIISKVFTRAEIQPSIVKLSRRIEDVKKLSADGIQYDDQRVYNVTHALIETIRDVFGAQSPQFYKYEHYAIWHGGYNMGDSDHSRQAKFTEGIKQAVILLEGLIDLVKEKGIELGEDPAQQAKEAIKGLKLHPRVLSICKDRFESGQYADAVFNASKSLVNFVKEKSGCDHLDGSPLMSTVFSKNNPILAFNDLKDQTDRDEQEGMMHLFMGMVLGIRNPRGHDDIYDSPEQALEYLGFLSLLANRLEATKRTK